MTDLEREPECQWIGRDEITFVTGHVRSWLWCARPGGLPECPNCPRGNRWEGPPLLQEPSDPPPTGT